MKVEIISGKTIDTSKLGKRRAKMIEAVEGSQLRQWAHENGGACFVWAKLFGKGKEKPAGWLTYYMAHPDSLEIFFGSVNSFIQSITNGRFSLQLIDHLKKEKQEKSD